MGHWLLESSSDKGDDTPKGWRPERGTAGRGRASALVTRHTPVLVNFSLPLAMAWPWVQLSPWFGEVGPTAKVATSLDFLLIREHL